jgi:hypothetical protein
MPAENLRYIVDEKGERTAVILPVEEYEELAEGRWAPSELTPSRFRRLLKLLIPWGVTHSQHHLSCLPSKGGLSPLAVQPCQRANAMNAINPMHAQHAKHATDQSTKWTK